LRDADGDPVFDPFGNAIVKTTHPFTDALELDAPKVMDGQIWRLLTYAFLHDTQIPLHIIFNMLFLWWFGSDVEDLYGSKEFLAVYLVGAVLGGSRSLQLTGPASASRPCASAASGAGDHRPGDCALHYRRGSS